MVGVVVNKCSSKHSVFALDYSNLQKHFLLTLMHVCTFPMFGGWRGQECPLPAGKY